ncbi:MAG: class I SAM-dependent methyltransferase [Candidatus Promineifilaceae bacterium]|nr:class I SAM-dependent methyltransferase [Candidatus Promineifilaceae bacterium]
MTIRRWSQTLSDNESIPQQHGGHRVSDQIRSVYDADPELEWQRLERHRTEFAVTLRALEDHLPVAPAVVLDLGGGPGRYAIALARRGYRVLLADLSLGNLRLARRKAAASDTHLVGTVQLNALDLEVLPAGAFDAVLMLGPLYHLLEAGDRRRAVSQARRVLRPGGTLAAAFITRFAFLRDSAQGYPEWFVENEAYARHLLATGVYNQPRGERPYFYFVHPDEVLPLMEGVGLLTKSLLGVEGVVAGHESEVNALRGPAWEAWVQINYEVAHEPSLLGAADHLLYVGQKADRRQE